MPAWTVLTASPEETRNLGRALGAELDKPLAIFLAGELGGGKTCFAQGVADGLGVPAEQAVTSPTFALMNQYSGRLLLSHFDLYRLGGADEVEELGFEECLEGPGVTVVEWPERLCGPPREGLHVDFEYAGEASRRLTFRATGTAAMALLARLRGRWPAGGETQMRGCDERV